MTVAFVLIYNKNIQCQRTRYRQCDKDPYGCDIASAKALQKRFFKDVRKSVHCLPSFCKDNIWKRSPV